LFTRDERVELHQSSARVFDTIQLIIHKPFSFRKRSRHLLMPLCRNIFFFLIALLSLLSSVTAADNNNNNNSNNPSARAAALVNPSATLPPVDQLPQA
jgi:hypothetical protein